MGRRAPLTAAHEGHRVPAVFDESLEFWLVVLVVMAKVVVVTR